jgi:hypothetical protein
MEPSNVPFSPKRDWPGTTKIVLKLADPKRGGGLQAAIAAGLDANFKDAVANGDALVDASFYESGVVAGINHGYLQLQCSCCLLFDCLGGTDCSELAEDHGKGEKFQRFFVVAGPTPVRSITSTSEKVLDNLRKVLNFAFAMKLCSCEEWFAEAGGSLCASCMAAIVVGTPDDCSVCHEPSVKRTRCCKQPLHRACHAQHLAHAPHGGAACPTCRAAGYGLA